MSANRQFPIRVDVRLTPEEREYLTNEAVLRGMSRQDLMRRLLLSDREQVAPVKPYRAIYVSRGRAVIDRAMKAVRNRYPQIPMHHLESIVSTVICQVAEGEDVANP